MDVRCSKRFVLECGFVSWYFLHIVVAAAAAVHNRRRSTKLMGNFSLEHFLSI